MGGPWEKYAAQGAQGAQGAQSSGKPWEKYAAQSPDMATAAMNASGIPGAAPQPQSPAIPMQENTIGKMAPALMAAGDVGTGAAKGAGHTLQGIDSLGQKAPIVGKYLTPTPEIQGMNTKPTNTAQKIGYGGEQVGEFLLPGIGEEAGAAKIASKLPMLGRFAAPAARIIPPALTMGAVNKAQGRDFSTGAAMGLGGGLASEGMSMLPSIERAGQNFERVRSAAGDVPLDIARPGDTALNIQRLAESGGSRPKVIGDFLKRATDPAKAPITFGEGRDFYSNASRLSADEKQRLTPMLKRQVGQFSSDLGSSLRGAADQAGVLEPYDSAMSEYSNAMKLRDFKDATKKVATKVAIGAIPGAGAIYGVKAFMDKR